MTASWATLIDRWAAQLGAFEHALSIGDWDDVEANQWASPRKTPSQHDLTPADEERLDQLCEAVIALREKVETDLEAVAGALADVPRARRANRAYLAMSPTDRTSDSVA